MFVWVSFLCALNISGDLRNQSEAAVNLVVGMIICKRPESGGAQTVEEPSEDFELYRLFMNTFCKLQ
jgi:hypothetical protein